MIIPQSAIDVIATESALTDAATVGLHTAGKVANTVGTIGKAVMTVKGTIGKNSITRMGKDSILEFPDVFGSIETDDCVAIAKTLEKHYAALLVSVFSLRPSVSLNEYDNISEFIKSIHSNNAIPTNLKKAHHFAKESYTGISEDDEEICLVKDEEPSGLCVNAEYIENVVGAKEAALECWGVQGGQLDSGNLNEMVQPYKRTQYLLRDRLDIAHAATEAASNPAPVPTKTIQEKAMGIVNVGRNNSTSLNLRSDGSAGGKGFKDVGKNSIVNNQKLTALEPTMINVSFYLHGSKTGKDGNASFTQNVVLGVKSMIRTVSSSYMITNLVEGSKTSNPIFKLISWTRGEYSLVKDLLFNVSEIKKKFRDKKNDEYGFFLDMSKDRKEVDDVSKFAGNRVLPYLSLIATDYEVAQAAQITGVDLSDFANAKSFMDKYYLLAFGIYNTNTQTLKIIFDGDSDFDTMTMTYMQAQQKQTSDINKQLKNMVSIN